MPATIGILSVLENCVMRRDGPAGTIRETRNFCRRRIFPPLIPHFSLVVLVVVVVARFPRCLAASACAASRHGSLLEMAPCRIFAKFPARSPITTGRRMKKHLSASGKEVRSASWHLFLRISRRIYYEITRGRSARWISIRPRTDSYFFSSFFFFLCFLSFYVRVAARRAIHGARMASRVWMRVRCNNFSLLTCVPRCLIAGRDFHRDF